MSIKSMKMFKSQSLTIYEIIEAAKLQIAPRQRESPLESQQRKHPRELQNRFQRRQRRKHQRELQRNQPRKPQPNANELGARSRVQMY